MCRSMIRAKAYWENWLAVAALILMASPQTLWAQTAATDAAPTSDQAVHVRVFTLESAVAADVAETVNQFFGSDLGRIGPAVAVADARTNSLIVSASVEAIETIAELISDLDQEAPATERQFKIFQLRNIAADDSLAETLSLIARDGTSVSVDSKRGVVITAGNPNALDTIEALLMRLDEKPAPKPEAAEPVELQVRIIWLASGLDSETGTSPPEDLENVIRELDALGITDLKTVAQLIVNTAADHPFTTAGSARLNGPCEIEVTGLISATGQTELFAAARGANTFLRPGNTRAAADGRLWFGGGVSKHPKLQLSISASQRGGDAPLCQLETTIRAPIGQSVVLGVTPIDSITSVFVVQVRKR